MAVLKKSSFPENLETFNVLVSDTLETSRYFTITDLPDTFTGGKNAFLIQGSEELVPDTVVKIEIKDAKGNVIYTEPGEGIPEYYEGVSKPVAVYVYPDTAYGQCTITILGELDRYDDNGIIRTVPAEWKDKYNVRWQKSVLVNPNLTNTTKIRFYRRPKVDITESILPVYNRTVTRETISGSVYGIAIQPRLNVDLRPFKGDTIYEIYATSSIFSASMEGESLSVTGLNQSYSTQIRDVVNDKKLIVTVPYFETSSNSPTSPQIVRNFVSGNIQLTYNKTVVLASSSLNTSFAKIKLTDLEAFTGDPARLKIFAKRKADIGNFTLLEDIQLESKELLNADQYSSSVDVNTGILSSQNVIDDFWIYSNYNRDTFYQKSFDNNSLASSVKLLDESVQNTSTLPQRIFYYSQSIDFNKDTEYELDFLPLLSSSLFTPNKIEVYLSGSSFFNSQTGTNLGKKIAELSSDGTIRRYSLQQINFKPESNGVGKLLFAIYQGNWQLSNIGLKASQESNFSPNEITINVSLPTIINNDEYEFKFEFYDINNNYVPVSVTKNFTFVGGSNLANVNLSASLFSVKPNSNIFPFGYNNNYDFQEVSTFASVPVGSERITFNVTKTGLSGNVVFTSAAFDSGGVYIEPSTYSSVPAPYPGFLNDINTDEPYLSVENFTGSLSNIEVKRIDYTASLGGYEDRISIFKVVEGTPGSDGENGEQYVIKPLTGTAIKNSNPTSFIELQIVKVSGQQVTDVSAGNIKLVTGSLNTVITVGNGIIAGTNGVEYNAKFYASKIDGLLEVKAYDTTPGNERIVDTISIADITDGLTTGFIEASNGLILNRDPNTNTYTPSTTALTASFYGSTGIVYTSSILITPSYSSPNDVLEYQTGITDSNINLVYVKTVGGVSMSPTPNQYSTKGLTAQFRFTEPNTGQQILVSEGVAITTNGSSGTAGAAGTSGTSGAAGSSGTNGAAGKVVQIVLEPQTQTVSRDTAGTYTQPAPFIVRVYENGSTLTYNTSQPLSDGQFTIEIKPVEGTNNSTNGTLSGSITPANLTLPMISSSADFAVKYKTTDGLVESQFISQSHTIGVTLEGQSGPGIVFTGTWESGRFYQFSDTRRDAVLWSRDGSQPYDTYYATLKQHTSDNSTGTTGNGAPNYSTGSIGSAWEELGQEDFFVAAKISIFEESFIKNTLNIGTSTNAGVSSANITLYGGNSYPYFSLGQSIETGNQGYGLDGIFLGAVNDSGVRKYRFSLVTGSSYIKWDGDGQLLVSGTVSASRGRIGGVSISGSTIFAGAGNYANKDTGFYLTSASTNIFSLADKFTWDGSNLNISGTISLGYGSRGSGVNITPIILKYNPYVGGYGGLSSQNYGNISSINGNSTENAISYATDPFGKQSLVWQCYPVGDNNGDGGWNTNYVRIDTSKSYKFIVYFKKYQSTSANAGDMYWGFYPADSTQTATSAKFIYDSVDQSNPYFYYGMPSNLNRWYLIIGYVHGKDYTGTTSLGGVYDCETGQRVYSGGNTDLARNEVHDYKWNSNNEYALHRAYLFYNSVGNGSTLYQEMWGAGMYEIDGNEPDLNTLLDKGKILAGGSASFSDLGTTFISANAIYSPNIAGNNGYFSETFKVGPGDSITLDGTNKKIYIGTGTYGNSNTAFYVASGSIGDNIFSLGSKLTWNGSTLNIDGTVTAAAGNIGGWSIGSTTLTGGTATLDSSGLLSIGSGNSIFKADSNGIYLGNATFASAPFRVTPAGALTATNATITGTITATAGSIGGLTIGSTKIYIGTGTWSNQNTSFYVDNSGQFSLKDRLTWDGTILKVSGSLSVNGANDFSLDVSGLYISASQNLIKLGTSNEIVISGSQGGAAPTGPKIILGTRGQTKVLSGYKSTLNTLGLVGSTTSYSNLGHTASTPQSTFIVRYVAASTTVLYTTQPTYAQSISVSNSPLKFGATLRLTAVIGNGTTPDTQVSYRVGLWRITSGGTATEIRSTTFTALPEASNNSVLTFNPFNSTVNLFDHTSDSDNFFWKVEFNILTGGGSPTCGFSNLDFGKIYTTEPYSEYASNGMQVASTTDEFFSVQPGQSGNSTQIDLSTNTVFCEIQSSNDYALHITGTAGKSSGTSWTSTSDRSIKENIIEIDEIESFEKIQKLKPVKFNYKRDFLNENRDRLGFIAQDYREVFPSATKGSPTGLLAIDNDDIPALNSAVLKHLLIRLHNLETQVYGSSSILISGSSI